MNRELATIPSLDGRESLVGRQPGFGMSLGVDRVATCGVLQELDIKRRDLPLLDTMAEEDLHSARADAPGVQAKIPCLSAEAARHLPDLGHWVKGLVSNSSLAVLGLTEEDLQQEAFLALRGADQRFDATKLAVDDPSGYYSSRVRWGVKDSVREAGKRSGIPRQTIIAARCIESARQQAWAEGGAAPVGQRELSELSGLSEQQVKNALARSTSTHPLSLDKLTTEDTTILDVLADPAKTPDEVVIEKAGAEALFELMHKAFQTVSVGTSALRKRAILNDVYGFEGADCYQNWLDNVPEAKMKEVGARHGVGESRACQIVNQFRREVRSQYQELLDREERDSA